MKTYNLEVEGIQCWIGLDTNHAIIHVLELSGEQPIIHVLNREFCEVIKQSMIETRKDNSRPYHFLIYHRSCTVSVYYPKTDDLGFLELKDERIYSEFKKEMFYLHGLKTIC